MIFCKRGNADKRSDITHLSETLAATPMDDDVLGALLAMAGNSAADFSGRGVTTMTVLLFQAALQRTISSCWLGIAQHYPGWDEAWDWLDEAVQAGTLQPHLPPNATEEEKEYRPVLVAKFRELLGPGADKNGPKDAVVGRKRSLDEAAGEGNDEWGPAGNVRQCLDVLRDRSPTTQKAVGVPTVAKNALGSDYLASVGDVFNVLHAWFVVLLCTTLGCTDNALPGILVRLVSLSARHFIYCETSCAMNGTRRNQLIDVTRQTLAVRDH